MERIRVRQGFTIIELLVAVLILSVSAAVVVPNWMQYQETVRVTSAAMVFSADIRSLRNHAIRSSQDITVQFTAGSPTLNIQPATPGFFGNAAGNVNYATRYPGFSFESVDFGGDSSFTIDMRGDLVSTNSSERLGSALVTIRVAQQLKDVELQLESVAGPSGAGTGSL